MPCRYEGDFENGWMHGKGVYKVPGVCSACLRAVSAMRETEMSEGGHTFTGDYKEGQREGTGKAPPCLSLFSFMSCKIFTTRGSCSLVLGMMPLCVFAFAVLARAVPGPGLISGVCSDQVWSSTPTASDSRVK